MLLYNLNVVSFRQEVKTENSIRVGTVQAHARLLFYCLANKSLSTVVLFK